MVSDVQELSKLQLDSLALAIEILLYAGSCLCTDISKAQLQTIEALFAAQTDILWVGGFNGMQQAFSCVSPSLLVAIKGVIVVSYCWYCRCE